MSVDPGRTIRLLGGGNSRITDGAARARRPHRGGYRRAGSDVRDNPASRTHNRAIWIGGAATLDVAGRAAGGVDIDGRRYGQAQAGGSILLGGALDWDATGIAESARDIAIVVRPGAVLDASGSRLAIDAPRGSRLGTLDLAGDGGQIVLKSSYGLFLDGDMRAGRGAGAAGGTLALALETPTFPLSVNAEDGVRRPRELILSQGTQASGLASDLKPGQLDPALHHGAAPVGAAVRGRRLRQPVAAGQRDSQFRRRRGPVGLAKPALLCRQLCRDRPRDGRHGRQPVRAASTAGRRGARLGDGVTPTVTWRDGASARPGVGSFTADADLIDIRDRVGFGARGAVPLLAGAPVTVDRRGFDQVSLNSRGDVRLLGGQAGRGLSGDATTELGTNGDLRITSAQLYPATGASATIWGGYETGRRLEILRQPGTESVASPLSVFGSLSLGADTVIQAGTVRAPLGSISLGQDARGSDSWRARSVELMPGSLTSVSGAGVMVPYGGTADGLTYTYAGAPLKPREQNAGGIAFSGHTLTGRQGAVLDLSGGGELRGAAFVAGRGGSVDILRTPLVNANPTFTNSAAGNAIYAIVPAMPAATRRSRPTRRAANPSWARR